MDAKQKKLIMLVSWKAKLKVCSPYFLNLVGQFRGFFFLFLQQCLYHLDCLPVSSVCLSQTCFPFCAASTSLRNRSLWQTRTSNTQFHEQVFDWQAINKNIQLFLSMHLFVFSPLFGCHSSAPGAAPFGKPIVWVTSLRPPTRFSTPATPLLETTDTSMERGTTYRTFQDTQGCLLSKLGPTFLFFIILFHASF